MQALRFQINDRRERAFYGARTASLLSKLDEEIRLELQQSFEQFYETALDYIEKWYRIDQLPTTISWIMLGKPTIVYEEVLEAAKQITPELAEKNALFDEVSALNLSLAKIHADSSSSFETTVAEDRWKGIFKNNALPCLYRLVSAILSIPVSNAFVERVFSLCGAQWTDDRNSLKVETVKALLQVKVNLEMNCVEMYHLLMKDEKLRKKIASGEKYN